MKLGQKRKGRSSMARFCSNILLERSDVGHVTRPYRILPPIQHTYGLKNKRD